MGSLRQLQCWACAYPMDYRFLRRARRAQCSECGMYTYWRFVRDLLRSGDFTPEDPRRSTASRIARLCSGVGIRQFLRPRCTINSPWTDRGILCRCIIIMIGAIYAAACTSTAARAVLEASIAHVDSTGRTRTYVFGAWQILVPYNVHDMIVYSSTPYRIAIFVWTTLPLLCYAFLSLSCKCIWWMTAWLRQATLGTSALFVYTLLSGVADTMLAAHDLHPLLLLLLRTLILIVFLGIILMAWILFVHEFMVYQRKLQIRNARYF